MSGPNDPPPEPTRKIPDPGRGREPTRKLSDAGAGRESTRKLSGAGHDPARPAEATQPGRIPTRPMHPETAAYGPEVEGEAALEDDEFIGMRIGDATLRARIGEGGMGLVFEAWQEPPGRVVAAKLIRAAVASDEARFRFEHEARILAALRHPAIAQIHSVGTHRAATLIPYFLMEYVPDARLITEYIEEQDLSLADTLRLFARVCRGVQAGHAKGIIHRDLKPANILVDDEGNPKLIDFGIARVAQEDETEATPRTQTGMLVGTVPYMSPEQFTGSRDDVDTRTDVYALGAILYEILAGRLPHDFEGLGVLDVIRKIQSEPAPPLAKWRPDVPGDVNLIVQKALSKDPTARYASADALAADIDRFLDRRPILARPPSVRYQLRMYARRHKALVASGVVIALTLVGSLIAISLFAASESRARSRAETEEQRAKALLSESAGFIPVVAEYLDTDLPKIVGTTRIRFELAEDLDALATRLTGIVAASEDPQVMYAVGKAGFAVAKARGGEGAASLGQSLPTLALMRAAVGQLERAHAGNPDNPAYLRTLFHAQLALAEQYRRRGDLEQGIAAFDKTALLYQRLRAETESENEVERLRRTIAWERTRGHFAEAQGKQEEALAIYQAALQTTKETTVPPGEEEWKTGASLDLLLEIAPLLLRMKRMEEAAGVSSVIQEMIQRLEAGEHSSRALAALHMAHTRLAEFAEQETTLNRALIHKWKALQFAIELSERDPNDALARSRVRLSRGALAETLERLKRMPLALEQYLAALAATREELSRDPGHRGLEWDLRVYLLRVAYLQQLFDEGEAAGTHFREAREIQTRRHEQDPTSAQEEAGLAEVSYYEALMALGREREGTPDAEKKELYALAAAALDRALAHLDAIEARGDLDPTLAERRDAWRRMRTLVGDAAARLETEK